MKRAFRSSTVALLTSAALGLAACSGGGSGSSGAAPAASPASCGLAEFRKAAKPVDITMWHGMGNNNGRVFEQLVQDFNDSQSDVHVKLVDQSAESSSLPKFRAGLTTGDVPDVIQVEETALQTMIDSQATVPVQACVDADRYDLSDFLPKVVAYYRTEGVLRSMPYNPSSPILFYDKNAFAAAGLDPERPPQTLDEVREYSERLVASGVVKHGISLRIAEFLPEFWSSKNGQVYANNANGRKARATKADLDNPTQQKVWTWWHDMVADGLALNTGAEAGSISHLLAMPTHDAAMTIESSSALGPIVNVLQSGQYSNVKVGTGELPGVRPGGGVQTGEGSLYMVNKGTPAQRGAAWQFIKYLVSPEALTKLHLETGYVPIRKSVADSAVVQDRWAKDPNYRVAYDQLLAGPTTPATTGPVIGDFLGVRAAVVDGITSMLTGKQTPLAALAATQRKADEVIAAYNARVAG